MSKVLYKASCWDCQDIYFGKTKRRFHDRKTKNFKAITCNGHSSALAEHVTSTGNNLKWDHFYISARGKLDIHCKIKETLLIRDLKPAKSFTYTSLHNFMQIFSSVTFICFFLHVN